MMKIAHVALWTRDIDAQLAFWQRYFNGEAGEEYVSRNRPGFVSVSSAWRPGRRWRSCACRRCCRRRPRKNG